MSSPFRDYVKKIYPDAVLLMRGNDFYVSSKNRQLGRQCALASSAWLSAYKAILNS